MRTTRLLSATLLTAATLAAVGATTGTAHAAGSTNLTVQYGGKVLKNEQFDVSGQLTRALERQVKLQYRSGDSWKTKATTTSNADSGSFFFSNVTTSKTRTYRYYAPATEGAKKVVGTARKVSVVSQKVTKFAVSDASQCRYVFDDSAFAPMTIFAQFYPARPGRGVTVVTEKYGTLNGFQDRAGIEAFTISPGTTKQSSTFQARTVAANGAAAKYSSTLTSNLTSCQLIML